MKGFIPLLTSLLAGLVTGLDWWEHGNFYQIYPRSFKDSDGDGIGDLNGITEKLQYLKDIGMNGIWLSPCFASPMADFGYDISDFRQIQPEYGDLDAFQRLSNKCLELGLHLILDFVPNHTSDEHEFFKLSVAKNETYKDYYIWHPGVDGADGKKVPPSNWISFFRGSTWEWNEQRQEFYLHQFLKQQPDLNFRNPAVVEEMKNVLRFWLDRGVSGFRIDAVPHLFESAEYEGRYRDEPPSGKTNDSMNPAYNIHSETMDQPETYDMIYQWRAVLDEYAKKDNRTRIIMTESYTSLPKIMEFFGNDTMEGAQMPFNFELMSDLSKTSTGAAFAKNIKRWLAAKPANRRSNWVLGNHDNSRIGTRLGENKIDLYNIALQTLPDIAVTYYGEEIGMLDKYIPWSETQDPAACRSDPESYTLYSRDPVRTPMQWDSGKNAGFSNASTTWLPVADNYKTLNVKAQNRARKSHLKLFKKLTKYRKRQILAEGDIDIKVSGDNLVVYKRKVDKVGYVVVALNFATETATLRLSDLFVQVNDKMQVVVSSKRITTADNSWVDVNSYELVGESAIVLQYLWGKNSIVV